MRVAVVVVAHGAGEHLDRTLAALERQTHKPARIIVVDNLGDMSQGLTPGRGSSGQR